MPAAMIAEVAAPAWSVLSKPTRSVRTSSGQADQPDGHRGDDAERALGADDGAEQVVAGAVGRDPAERHDVALGGDEVGAEDVVGGEAVLQAVRAAGVLRDVAADRADLLARRVGRVVVAVGRRRLGDVEVDHARLDDGALVLAAYGGDGAHLRGHDQHALGVRAALRRTGPCPDPRATYGTRVLGARAHDGGELRGVLGYDDQGGRHPVVGQPVALVGAQPGAVGDHARRRAAAGARPRPRPRDRGWCRRRATSWSTSLSRPGR